LEQLRTHFKAKKERRRKSFLSFLAWKSPL